MFAQSPKTRLLGGRTLDGTKSAKASVGEFLVLFAVKKVHKLPRAETAVNRRPKSGKEQPAKRAKCFDGEGMRTLADYSR